MRTRRKLAIASAILSTAILLSGCVQTVTETVNGRTVSAAPGSDVDACGAITSATVAALGLADEKPAKLTDPAQPGCEWSGANPYTTPDLALWVLGPDGTSSSDDTTTISGVAVGIWSMSDTDGRYIVPCGEHDLTLNYTQAKGPLGPKDALDRAAADAIDAYGCGG
jgi:hypothetical protein